MVSTLTQDFKKKQEELFKKVIDHKHCWRCFKVLPPYQNVCADCVMELSEETRESYYTPIVEEVIE